MSDRYCYPHKNPFNAYLCFEFFYAQPIEFSRGTNEPLPIANSLLPKNALSRKLELDHLRTHSGVKSLLPNGISSDARIKKIEEICGADDLRYVNEQIRRKEKVFLISARVKLISKGKRTNKGLDIHLLAERFYKGDITALHNVWKLLENFAKEGELMKESEFSEKLDDVGKMAVVFNGCNKNILEAPESIRRRMKRKEFAQRYVSNHINEFIRNMGQDEDCNPIRNLVHSFFYSFRDELIKRKQISKCEWRKCKLYFPYYNGKKHCNEEHGKRERQLRCYYNKRVKTPSKR